MCNTDVEMMQLAWDYVATFDNPLTYENLAFENSAHSFFIRLIEHGAELTYSENTNGHTGNFYNDALWWIMLDGVRSDLDDELLELIEEGMNGK